MDWEPIITSPPSAGIPIPVSAPVAIDTTSPKSGIVASIATPAGQINLWQDTTNPPSPLPMDEIIASLAKMPAGLYSSPSLKIMAEITNA